MTTEIILARDVINVLKDLLAHRDVSTNALAGLQKTLGLELDRCKVNNLSTAELERLYDDVLWLQSEIVNA